MSDTEALELDINETATALAHRMKKDHGNMAFPATLAAAALLGLSHNFSPDEMSEILLTICEEYREMLDYYQKGIN